LFAPEYDDEHEAVTVRAGKHSVPLRIREESVESFSVHASDLEDDEVGFSSAGDLGGSFEDEPDMVTLTERKRSFGGEDLRKRCK